MHRLMLMSASRVSILCLIVVVVIPQDVDVIKDDADDFGSHIIQDPLRVLHHVTRTLAAMNHQQDGIGHRRQDYAVREGGDWWRVDNDVAERGFDDIEKAAHLLRTEELRRVEW